MSMGPGSRVGPYEIVASLGSGGMGEVYRARDPKLGRELAIKVLPADTAPTDDLLGRFEQEARSASLLNHPAIITIYDVGRVGEQPWIAMELVEGQTLRESLASGPLPLKRALSIAMGVAEGLAAAHARGIVHRDLKPDNIMVSRDGHVKILDFGLAKLVASGARDDENTAPLPARHTAPGTILGTVGYMSPEQAGGEPADFRSDQFSFGMILFEMLSGVRPFQRDNTVSTLHAIMNDPLPQIRQFNPSLPDSMLWVLERLLSKRADDRYAATQDLVRDLQRVHDETRTTGSTAPATRRPRMRRAIGGVAGLGLVLLIAGLIGSYVGTRRAEVPRNKALAVLPFTDLSGDARGQLYSRGVSETVSVRLASVEGLRVMPPLAAMDVDLRNGIEAAARQLGANLLLHGTLQRSGGELRINYTLMNDKGEQLAADSFRGSASEVFLLEDRIADSVVDALALQTAKTTTRASGLASGADQVKYLEALGLLQRYENEQSVDQAIDALQALERRVKGSGLLYAALGRAYLYKHSLTAEPSWIDRAADACRTALRLNPGAPDVHVTLGELRLATGDYEAGITEFQRALEMQPGSSEAMLNLAEAFDKGGRSADAESTYRRVIQMNPAWWSAYNHLGTFLSRRGRADEAIAMFRKVVELTPDNVRGWNNLGSVFLSLGRSDEALAAFSRSVSIRPNSDALSSQATILYYGGKYREAALANQRAVALSAGDYQIWFNLADSWRQVPGEEKRWREGYARAIELSERSLKTNERDPTAHAIAAVACAKTGQGARAAQHLERALAIAPDDPQTLYFGAVVENVAGDGTRAIYYIEQAIGKGFSAAQLRSDPEFRNLNGNQRFQELLSKAGG
jgi:serine/threonine-protein kinase